MTSIRVESERPTREALAFLDSFRAVAIVLVVFGHSYRFAWGGSTGAPGLPSDLVYNVISGATALFVFVSGFLLHHVYHGRKGFEDFLRAKARNVLAPYAVITLVLVTYIMLRDLIHVGPAASLRTASSLPVRLASGAGGASLWYVPFILVVFCLTPLFFRFASAGPITRAGVLSAALLVGLFVNRPVGNADKIQAVLYFGFYYLAGITCSVHAATFIRFVRQRSVVLAAAALVGCLAAVQTADIGVGPYEGGYFEPGPFDFLYAQKVCLIVVICGVFAAAPSLNAAWLKRLAADSFGIFFVHNLVLMLVLDLVGWPDQITASGLPETVFWGTVVLTASWAIVHALKGVLGARSQLLVGA